MATTYSKENSLASKKHMLWVGLIIALTVVALLLILKLHYDASPRQQHLTPSTGSSSASGISQTPNKGEGSSQSPSSKDGNSQGSGRPSNGVELLTPSGVFVSNHHPNLSGYPAPNQIQSVCTTTPGATCTVVFTKDGATRSLPDQTTDLSGSAYWTWKLQDIGLTTGTWHVQAKANLGSQVKTADDANSLEVEP